MTLYIQGFHVDNENDARAHVNMWLAPWNRPYYIGGTGTGLVAINTNASCLPGSTWRQMNIPSLLYTTQANTGDIGSNGMLSNTMTQPMYEINTASDAATHGDVMANGAIPTLNPGSDNPAPFYDATPWQCFIFEIESIFGAPITSRPVMHQMYKIDFSFLGVRCQRGAETDHLPYRHHHGWQHHLRC